MQFGDTKTWLNKLFKGLAVVILEGYIFVMLWAHGQVMTTATHGEQHQMTFISLHHSKLNSVANDK